MATASSNLGYYFQIAPTIAQNYSAVWNSILSPRFSNQVLFGIGVFHQIYHDAKNTFNLQSLGLDTSPAAVEENGQPILGSPNIVIGPPGTFDEIGITPPEGRDSATGHVGDILSYVVGKHQFRFGGEFRQGHVDESYYRRSTGVFNFFRTANAGTSYPRGPWNAYCESIGPNPAPHVISTQHPLPITSPAMSPVLPLPSEMRQGTSSRTALIFSDRMPGK